MLWKPFSVVAFLAQTAFCLGEKQGMSVNDEFSSWCNGVDNFYYQFGIGDNSYCTLTDQRARPDESTLLLQSA